MLLESSETCSSIQAMATRGQAASNRFAFSSDSACWVLRRRGTDFKIPHHQWPEATEKDMPWMSNDVPGLRSLNYSS